MLIDEWLSEQSTSALPATVKEYACYLTLASVAQAQERRFKYTNSAGIQMDLGNVKVISVSTIITGKPGSYKSETVKFIKRILSRTGLVWVYPHDQVTREYLLSTFVEKQALSKARTISGTILIDELVNFLNRKEYVEPLIGTMNSLLDQPDTYAVGTHKRQTEVLKEPFLNVIFACAPGWFSYLPEALFTGGYAGRCMFYEVPYPADKDRQPRGSICVQGAEDRLAKRIINMPNGHFVLTHAAISMYDNWELEWGKEDVHPLPVLDEWFKRRCVNTVRLAGAVALSRDTIVIDEYEMLEANKHLEHVRKTLERVWFQVDTDSATAHRMLQMMLTGIPRTLQEIESVSVKYLRNAQAAQRTISWWLDHNILTLDPTTKKYLILP